MAGGDAAVGVLIVEDVARRDVHLVDRLYLDDRGQRVQAVLVQDGEELVQHVDHGVRRSGLHDLVEVVDRQEEHADLRPALPDGHRADVDVGVVKAEALEALLQVVVDELRRQHLHEQGVELRRLGHQADPPQVHDPAVELVLPADEEAGGQEGQQEPREVPLARSDQHKHRGRAAAGGSAADGEAVGRGHGHGHGDERGGHGQGRARVLGEEEPVAQRRRGREQGETRQDLQEANLHLRLGAVPPLEEVHLLATPLHVEGPVFLRVQKGARH
mmetsp:Transcript_19127/g.57424  ORF Transcript_19127/g.57424 Transcript_19127/m.57424 type:complete len:273 (+) Transcript_19127:949-1767(+)